MPHNHVSIEQPRCPRSTRRAQHRFLLPSASTRARDAPHLSRRAPTDSRRPRPPLPPETALSGDLLAADTLRLAARLPSPPLPSRSQAPAARPGPAPGSARGRPLAGRCPTRPSDSRGKGEAARGARVAAGRSGLTFCRARTLSSPNRPLTPW